MYGTAMANPVVAADGNITDVAYSSAFTIGVGAMMNVSNPHPLFLLTQSLPNTGIVQMTGDPQDKLDAGQLERRLRRTGVVADPAVRRHP